MSTGIGVIDRLGANIEELRNPPPESEKTSKVEGKVIRPPNESFKSKYVEALTNPEDTNLYIRVDFENLFNDISANDVQDIYLSLKHLFTEQCTNTHRSRIVECFLKVAKDEWPELVKQINFIMPPGTAAHDVMWATEILTSANPFYRNQLITTASRLFVYDTLTVERGYILNALSKLYLDDLQQIDTYDATQREEFRKKHVPQNVIDGAKIAYVFDPIIEKGWHL